MKNSKAYIWSFIGKFGGQIMSLLTTLVLARLLTPADFGTIGVVSVLFVVANTLTDSGLGGALMMEKELNRENCGTIFVFNLTISLFLSLIIFGFSSYIEAFYNIDGLAQVTSALCVVFLINAFGLVPKSILTYQLKFKQLSLLGLFSTLLSSIIAIGLAYCGMGVWALVIQQIMSAFFSTLSAHIVSKYRLSLCFDLQCFKRMFSFGVFTTIANVIDSIYENLAAVIFGKFLSVVEAGYLTQAKKLEETASQSLMMTVNATSYPILSKLRDNLSEFTKEANNILTIIPLLVAPILIVVGIYSKEVILLLLGENWIEAAPYLTLLVLAGYFMMNESISRNLIKSLKAARVLFISTIIKRSVGFLLLLTVAFLSIDYILWGYVLSSLVGYLITSFAYSKLVKHAFWKVQLNMLLKTIPLLILLVVVYMLYTSFDVLIIKISVSVLAFAIYYVIILLTMKKSLKGRKKI